MMKNLEPLIQLLLPHGNFDAVAVGVINFSQGTFSSVEAVKREDDIKFNSESTIYFDLASLTKPLSNSLGYFLNPEAFNQDTLLCLNHRAGLPSWGLLPRRGWKEQILSYPIHESETLYSDFSALRVMLELEKKSLSLKKLCQEVWDQETLYWTDLPPGVPLLQYGYKDGLPNFGEVHDPNAWVIGDFCSHAGLFSTITGLCKTLLSYEKKTNFISKIAQDLTTHSYRFSYGWDRVVDPKNTLAGMGCGPKTFGHLGFTGTSIWIDPDKMRGHVILSNAVKDHWFDKTILNDLRRLIGAEVWKSV